MKPYLRLVHPRPNVVPREELERLRKEMFSKSAAAHEISALADKTDAATCAILKVWAIELHGDVIDISRRLRM
jgi:hypothetical protein